MLESLIEGHSFVRHKRCYYRAIRLSLNLVTEQVVHEGGSRVSVTADGDAFVDAVGVAGDDVVQLVAHSAGPGVIPFDLILSSSIQRHEVQENKCEGDHHRNDRAPLND